MIFQNKPMIIPLFMLCSLREGYSLRCYSCDSWLDQKCHSGKPPRNFTEECIYLKTHPEHKQLDSDKNSSSYVNRSCISSSEFCDRIVVPRGYQKPKIRCYLCETDLCNSSLANAGCIYSLCLLSMMTRFILRLNYT